MSTIFQKDARLPEKLTVLFLGDSITDNGLYVAFLDACFRLHHPGLKLTFIPLGVSSETASGLSEKDHPFPRPCVHERLQRALAETKPDWVVTCYGINDGIYHPFSEERFASYRNGILALMKEIRLQGAKALVMTPPPFDTVSFEGPLLEAEAPDFSYKAVYRAYDQVMERYSHWLQSPECPADACVNIRDPLLAHTSDSRKGNPEYRSGDGIHPNALGHWIIAKTLLARLFNITLERLPDYVEFPEQSVLFSLLLERHQLLRAAWKEHIGHTNPNKEPGALPLEAAREAQMQLEQRLEPLLAEAGCRLRRTSDDNGIVT